MADKWTPTHVMTLFGMRPVAKAQAFPPGQHPVGSCIDRTLTLVQLTADNGEIRQYGFKTASIDSYLRMRVSGFNPLFEEVARWENAKEE